MATGPRDTKNLVLHTGWDATELKNWELEDGTTYASVVAMINTSLGALNAEIFADPLISSLVSYQDEPDVSYRVGVSNGFERHTEYGTPDPQRADTEGHMLPLIPYDRGLGWTWDYLRSARMPDIDADIADAIKDAKDKFRVQVLTRVLKQGDDSGDSNGLGTSGYSAGFATAAGNTNVDFTPPAMSGTTFTSSHEHYVAISGGAFTNDVFKDAKDELREHGHEPPYEFLIGPSDESTVEGLTDFIPNARMNVRYGDNVSLATLGAMSDMNGGYYIGTIHDFSVKVIRGMPQYYGFAYKTYGANSRRNPLRMRLKKGMTRPMITAMPDPRAGNGAYPLQYLMLFTEFGVGVGDRTNGTARYVNNASWSDGTPT